MTGTLRIDTLVHGGSGLGRCDDGKVCFVPYTAPGDLVSFRTLRETKGYRVGELLSVIEPSVLRVTPPCPNFRRCGGCQWQHISRDAQIGAKRLIVEGFFAKLRVAYEGSVHAIPSPYDWGYRFRAQFKLRWVNERILCGFYAPGTHRVVPLPPGGCPILTPRLNDAVRSMAEIIARSPSPDTVPQVDIAHGDQEGVVVTVHLLDRDRERMLSWLARQQGGCGADSLYVQQGRKNSLALIWGDGALSYTVRGGESSPSLRVTRGGFFQGNLYQNRVMIETVRRVVTRTAPRSILDLYCGNGNFSIPVASPGVALTGIEEYAPSIEDACFNARRLGIEPELIVGDAAMMIDRLVSEGRRYDLVIVDPPRTGAFSTVRRLPDLEPAVIVSVSCDPATLARDLRPLVDAGYRVDEVILFDLFPQTFHIETVTILTRGD